MKFLIATALLAATVYANPIATPADNSCLVARDDLVAPGSIATKYDGKQPQDVFLEDIEFMTFTTNNCKGPATAPKHSIYGQDVSSPKMRSMMISRDLMNAESIAFMTTANSPVKGIWEPYQPGKKKRGTPTINERDGTLGNCMKIVEYPSATPLPSGMFLLRLEGS